MFNDTPLYEARPDTRLDRVQSNRRRIRGFGAKDSTDNKRGTNLQRPIKMSINRWGNKRSNKKLQRARSDDNRVRNSID